MCQEKQQRSISRKYCLADVPRGTSNMDFVQSKIREILQENSEIEDPLSARFTITIKFRRFTVTITITF
jgi:hypothetical protein